MLCDVTEAACYSGYASPASLYRLLKSGLLDDYVELYKEQVLLRMGAKGKSPILAKRVRSLVNFKGGHEMFMFNPTEPDSIQKMRDRNEMKRQQKITTKKA